MDKQSDGIWGSLMKWDTLLGQRVLDTISFLVPAFLLTAYAVSPKASDLENGFIQFGLLFCFLLGSVIRLLSGWNKVRSFRFQIASAVFDIGFLFGFLLIIPLAYGSPTAISLKAPTANLLFVFIIARIVLFDIRLIVWSGLSAALGWACLTMLALLEPASPGTTREFIDYTTSGKILIGAQVEQIISILLVTIVSAAVVNAYQRDGLTGLRKKREFVAAFRRRLVSRAKRGDTVLILVQIDNWHAVANSNKADANKVVKALGVALLGAPVPHEMAARFESDAIILWKRCAPDDAALRHHLDLLQRRAQESLEAFRVTVSIGAARVGASADETLQKVVLATDRAATQKPSIQICDAAFETWMAAQAELKDQVASAIENNRLVVQHQPVVDMLSGRMVGTEALVRLRAEDGSFVSPVDFIPIAEETGAIDEIGAYVLDQASYDNLALRQANIADDPFVSVNVAPLQVHAWHRLKASADEALKRGTKLKLEITESSAAQDISLHTKLIELRTAGAKLAIDDFGTGYSSLERLGDMPFDTVKIDIAFTRKIETDMGFAMIDAIVRMANASGKDIIIDGIETPEQQALALKAGIRLGQGYLFSRPVGIEDLLADSAMWADQARRKSA